MRGRLEQRKVPREGLGVVERVRLVNVRGLVRVRSEIFLIELVSGNEIVCLELEGMILPGLDTKRARSIFWFLVRM